MPLMRSFVFAFTENSVAILSVNVIHHKKRCDPKMRYQLFFITLIQVLAVISSEIAQAQDSLLMTCAQHGNGVMTLKFVREAGTARSIEVIGQTSPAKWTVKIDGIDATPPTQTLNSPGTVAVHVADTITFKVKNPRHGILFLSEDLARRFLDFDEAAGKPLDDRPPKGEFDWGTDKFNGPSDVLAIAKVREASADAEPTSDEEFLAKLSPSMQRRMLRFVNRAYKPEDLTKSPQEFRTKSEHMPLNENKKTSDAKIGFARGMAEELISRRPLDGYRDVRECLPVYKSSGRLDDMSGVVESLGPTRFGKWDEVAGRMPSVMHAALMHTGKVLFITNSKNTVIWDPAGPPEVFSGDATGLTDILYCSGQSFLSDGRLLAVGGGGSDPGMESSIHGWKFDPVTSKWSRTSQNMAFRRWYPTLVTLGDEPGRVLVAAGSMGRTGPAPRMEVYSETTDSFETTTATGPVGDLLFEPTYPGLHLLPGGEIFHAPTGFNDCNQAPITSADVADPTAIFRFTSDISGSWTKLGANNRLKGMSVLLFDTTFPFVQGLVVGGGEGPKNGTAQSIDLSSMSPAWSPTFPLLEARVHPNLVVLPDGTVLICGGKVAGTTPPPHGGKCELHVPMSGRTIEMDDLILPRHYHSVALLLPDARVMVAGGAEDEGCTISKPNPIEVFSPPYLFRGSRPVISSATGFVEHGATIEIKTPAASEIQRVVLARPAAVTHQTDSEQRVIPLSFQVTGSDSIEAKAPGGTGANPIAPRGYYMLFILNQQGVPSVSKWIFLR